jgi:trehalose-6-phosphatase|tara:strand:+ start:102 stop:608 length:507 start_codon:yes stop_codon:yes gene_type:complete
MTKQTNKQFTQSEKAKRGWWASVVFMLLIIGLIWFLAKHEIVEKNRDILIGIIGMLTGSISSMLAIASGRDPSEVEELKDKLSSANGDREALIARLRDAQIQMQLLRQQIFELQNAVIDKLSIFKGQEVIFTKTEDQVKLKGEVERWITPKNNEDGDDEKIDISFEKD